MKNIFAGKPQITIDMENYIASRKETYRLNIDEILIDVFPGVFPPRSSYSESTALYENHLDVKGKSVLDIGTGTGILAIKAALLGAYKIHAVDTSSVALDCAKNNMLLNQTDVKVYFSDIFSHISESFDVILASLPILNLDVADTRLYDPGFKLHQRLFREGQNHLNPGGSILITHADLINDFDQLEDLIKQNNYEYTIRNVVHALGHEWRLYELKL